MTISERRLLANKRNAQRSTGPKTAKGKLISRNNAFRHGLARRVATDPAFSTHLENLTAMLAEGSNDAWHRELAQNVAECMLELDRIRAASSQILLGLGEFESADLAGHEEAVAQLQKIDRYEQRLYARRRKAVRALVDASRSGAQEKEARLEHRCNKASSGEGPISQNEANNWQNEPKFGTTDSALPEQDRV